MFVKQDYDYVELAQFIKVENTQLYYLIKSKHKEDEFVMLVEEDVSLVPSEDELNDYMYKNKEKIIKYLSLDKN